MKTFEEFGINTYGFNEGENYTTCPKCSSTRKKKKVKCLSVNTDKNKWNCHHCGWNGSLEEGVGKSTEHWHKPKYTRPEPRPPIESELRHVQWASNRGITEDVLKRHRISLTRIYMPQVEDWVNAMAFPYYRNGELINCKYRDGRKNFRFEVGAEPLLYGIDDLEEDCTILVEGEMDKLALEVAGFTNVVSVPNGAPNPDAKNYSSKFDYLENDLEKIRSVNQWILAVDNDEAGQKLEYELARRLDRAKCLRVVWPDGVKDANQCLVDKGKEALISLICEAKAYPIEGVFTVDQLSREIDVLYEFGLPNGVSTGFRNLDQYYTVKLSDWTVVTGVPNSGKSNFVDALCMNLARLHGWSFANFSPENQPIEDHIARMCEKFTDKPFNKGRTPRMTPEELEQAKTFVNDHFTWILPDDDKDWTIDNVLNAAELLIYRKGIQGLVIDPWNELEIDENSQLSETQYISQSLKRMRQFAKKHDIHLWIVAHPQKLYKGKDGKYPIPTLYDISGSAHWRNKADNGIVIYRDMDNDNFIIDVIVQKIRFKQVGRLGTAHLEYNPITATYSDNPRRPIKEGGLYQQYH